MVTSADRLDFIVGSDAADKLDECFGIRTVGDLLRHYPRSYVEGTGVRGAADSRPAEGDHITIVDTISSAVLKDMQRRNGKYLAVTVGSGRNKVSATFFNPKGLRWRLTPGTRVMLSGEVKLFRGAIQLTHPDFLVLKEADGAAQERNFGSSSLRNIADASQKVSGQVNQADFERSCYPIYPATAKLQSWDIFNCVRQVLDVLDPVPDPLPAAVRTERDLLGEDEALRAIHLSENAAERDRARARLAVDEAFGLQWALAMRRNGELSESGSPAPRRDNGMVAELLRRLPFELTAGQRDVLGVFEGELAASRPMNRLLQGEVGSGKTIVALLAMLQLVDAGYQCALLAPTEVLAAQHARSIRDMLGPLALGGQLDGADDATAVALLTGSMSAAAKKQARAEIASGRAGIVVGTHALLVDAVEFHNLGMVVVDEQHRFGVEQRDRLRAKAPDGITPHLLVMTATPIPRTVALTVYGDLETSTLRELPRGRQPIASSVIFVKETPTWLDRAWARIREEVAAGRQAYVVAPRIDETDEPSKPGSTDEGGRTSATAVGLFDQLRAGPLSGLRLGLMHGRLTGDEKDAVMTAFRSGAVDVLVCTTVIEVGVDVPNATVMLIADADWFGISQLHQLRGRIGRGEHASLCLLVTSSGPGTKAGQRLKAVAGTLDGFVLADLDLAERGEGDVLGRNQSGWRGGLKLLSLADHGEVIEAARAFCMRAWEANPDDPGLATLAAHFTDIDYLDKS
ncbi:ATP-dependent DNA helicase RecG [Mycolicibacter virginiensis]|uniref:ATP-dependent DNA helicase RecG n=1 Tax=Mycolicibacter virginiensis TaxID=1795032 RepID=A0A9X7IM26_9MYCO|nr:ATP-dependent DNA helicase RecG [Mycolicibacter virginiensis]PQM51732.1 ATP-dependent DNA helicase RecG [Mycolicibacter virginiensis]ULP46198.1 ATP-dependent DNA helicase RecG [Mycolicibacter virginiensis]